MSNPENNLPPQTPDKYCKKCNYPLIGLDKNRCPECGHEFDPDDPKTYKKSLKTKWQHETIASFSCLIISIIFDPMNLLHLRMVPYKYPFYNYYIFFIFIAFSLGFGISMMRRGDIKNRIAVAIPLTISAIYIYQMLETFIRPIYLQIYGW